MPLGKERQRKQGREMEAGGCAYYASLLSISQQRWLMHDILFSFQLAF